MCSHPLRLLCNAEIAQPTLRSRITNSLGESQGKTRTSHRPLAMTWITGLSGDYTDVRVSGSVTMPPALAEGAKPQGSSQEGSGQQPIPKSLPKPLEESSRTDQAARVAQHHHLLQHCPKKVKDGLSLLSPPHSPALSWGLGQAQPRELPLHHTVRQGCVQNQAHSSARYSAELLSHHPQGLCL